MSTFKWYNFTTIGLSSYFINKWFAPSKPDFAPEPFEAPKSEIGDPIGVVFGTKLVKAPHIGWFGDVKITKETVESGAKK